MLYASSKQALRTPLGGGVNKDVQASTFDDISKDEGALLPFFKLYPQFKNWFCFFGSQLKNFASVRMHVTLPGLQVATRCHSIDTLPVPPLWMCLVSGPVPVFLNE